MAAAITASQTIDRPDVILLNPAAADGGLTFGLSGGKELKLLIDLTWITTPSPVQRFTGNTHKLV